jgi:hypothetical protein
LKDPESADVGQKLKKFEIQNYGFNRDVSTANLQPEISKNLSIDQRILTASPTQNFLQQKDSQK